MLCQTVPGKKAKQPSAQRRMGMRTMLCILLGLLFMPIFGLNPAYSQEEQDMNRNDTSQIVRARVLDSQPDGQNYLLTVQITGGHYSGQIFKLPYVQANPTNSSVVIRPGDDMLVQLESDNNIVTNAYISDYVRDRNLLYLAAAFVFILIIMGGRKGVKSVISLIISGGAIFFVMLPLIFRGHDPILTTVLISTAVSILTLFIIAGKNTKTLAAIIGTTG